MLASAAISALVLPLPVGDRIATDGGWVRNFPLGAALDHPDVNLVVAFRYVPRYPHIGIAALGRVRPQAEPLPGRPSGPRLDRRARRGRERASSAASRCTSATCSIRLMRVAIQRNTALEEQLADERDAAMPGARSAARRRHPHRARARAAGPPQPGGTCCRGALRADGAAPTVPRITVRGSGGAESLEQGFRSHREWSEDAKRALIARGYAAADAELAATASTCMEQAG